MSCFDHVLLSRKTQKSKQCMHILHLVSAFTEEQAVSNRYIFGRICCVLCNCSLYLVLNVFFLYACLFFLKVRV